MKKLAVKYIGKLFVLTLFISTAILATITTAQATPLASVTYLENWDSANTEWDYAYSVMNQSDAGEYFYDFYLDMFGLSATLSNISDPADWEHFTDDSTFIEWTSILFTGSEIAPGNSLAFNFSSDTQLGDLYYELLTADEFGVPLDFPDDMISSTSTASAPVPEPATIILLGSALLGMVGLQKKKIV